MRIEELLEAYAKHKIEMALQKNDEPLRLEEEIIASYSKQTPFVIIAPTPARHWHGDLNPFEVERKFREERGIEGKTPFFVINNESNAHWNFYRSQEPKKIIESSGKDLACGAYTFLNVIKNSVQFQELESVKELIESVIQSDGIDLRVTDINQLSAEKVRLLTAQVIDKNKEKLVGMADEEKIHQSLQRILKPESMLVSDDLRYAFQGLGIDFHEIANFRNVRGPEEIKVSKELVVNNLLGRAEKSRQYFDEEKEVLRQFLISRPEIENSVEEVVDFLFKREAEKQVSRNRSIIRSKKAYELNADDSSDDEEVSKKTSQYDLRKEWQSFCLSGGAVSASESYQGLSDEEKEQYYLPFLLHSFGTGLLYSDQVNDKYYSRDVEKGLKEKYLYDVRKAGEAKRLVERNLEKIVARVEELFLPNSTKESRAAIIEHVKKSLNSTKDESLKEVVDLAVEGVVDYVNKNQDQFFSKVKIKELRDWQRQNDYYKDDAGKIVKCADSGWKLYDDGIWAIETKKGKKSDIEWQLEKDGSRTRWQGDGQIEKKYERRLYPGNRGQHHNYNSSTEVDWVRNYFHQHVASLPEKSKKLLQRSFLNHVVKPLEEAGVIVENTTKSSAEKSPHQIVSSKWWEMEGVLRKQNLNRACSALDNARSHGKMTNFEKLLEDGRIISSYFQDIADDLESGGQNNLFKHFIEEVFHNTFLTRKTLPDRYATDNIEDVSDFLAQIRLSNRSKKREIKNLKEAPARKDFQDDDILSRITRFWKFNDGVVAQETQTISSSILAREAEVVNLGSYPDINDMLSEKIITKFNQKYPDKEIEDKDIAKWVRQKLKGEVLDIEDDLDIERLDVDKINRFVTEFTYLLFGCEVARNPASLVSHQMMLDLIIAEEKTWEDFLGSKLNETQQEMPMAPIGAVPEGRAANAFFAQYMPWEYEYPGEESSYERLIKAENDLFEKWLEYKKINSQFSEEGLLLACDDWFGIDMQRVIYGSEEEKKSPDNPAQVALNKWVESAQNDEDCTDEKDFKIMNDLMKKYGIKLSEKEKKDLSEVVMDYVYSIGKYISEFSPQETEFFELLAKNKLFKFEGVYHNSSRSLLENYIVSGVDYVAEMMIPCVSLEFLNKQDVLYAACESGSEKICKMLLDRDVEVSDEVRETEFYKDNPKLFEKSLNLASIGELLEQALKQKPERQESEDNEVKEQKDDKKTPKLQQVITRPRTSFASPKSSKLLTRSSLISFSRSGSDSD